MNKTLSILIIIFGLPLLIQAITSEERINEAVPLIQKLLKTKSREEFMSAQNDFVSKFSACFSQKKESVKTGSGIISPSKDSDNLDEIKGILIDDLVTGVKKVFSDIDSQDNLSSVHDDDMVMVKMKAEEFFESRIDKFAAIVKDNLKISSIKMLQIHKENEPYQRSSFKLKSVFEKAANELTFHSFKILDVIHQPENLKGYHVEQSWWARFVTWLKSLFGFQPKYEPTKEYTIEKNQKYAEYAQNKIYTYFVNSDACFEAYDEISDVLHNYYSQVELTANLIVLKCQEKEVQEGYIRMDETYDYLNWMIAVNSFVKVGIDFKTASATTIGVLKRISKAFSEALKIDIKTTAENLKENSRIKLWKSYWAFVSQVSKDSQETALKIMKFFWADCGMKFGSSAQKENVLAARKLATYVNQDALIKPNVYSYLLAALCLHLPDNEEIESPIADFDKVLSSFADNLDLSYLPRQLISGNSKILYAPVILAKDGFVLNKVEDLLEKDLLFDVDEPFAFVEAFGTRLNHDLDNISQGSRKFGNSKQIYVVLKLINLWATNDKNELPSVTIEMPRDDWDLYGWRAEFTDMDSLGKLVALVDTSLKSQGKNFDAETLGPKDLKQMVSHVFTWEEMRAIEPELAALLDAKQRQLLMV